MSQSGIVPVARKLYVCDQHVGYGHGRDDLYGIFGTIHAPQLPWTQKRFCAFTRLTDSFGHVPFVLDIRAADTYEMVLTTAPRQLYFPSRTAVHRLALTIEGCTFPRAGVYIVELICHHECVADTVIVVRRMTQAGGADE